MKKEELELLEKYLRQTFRLEDIELRQLPRNEEAEVFIGDRLVGNLLRDDEDGDVSYQFEMTIQRADDQRAGGLENYLRQTFKLPTIEVRKRPRKEDSVEVFVDDEFIGVVFDDEQDRCHHFQMAILDYDLAG